MRHYLVLSLAALSFAAAFVSVLCSPVYGQAVQPVIPQPDCAFFASLTTATMRSGSFDNRFNGCVTWAVTYFNSGFGPVSLELDSASDSSGAPGAWGAFSGTVLAGTNPMTSTTQTFVAVTGYNPWISLKNGSTGAGTITAFIYGFRVPAQTYTSSGGVTQDVNLIKVGGAAIALGQAAMAASVPVVLASNQTNVPVNNAQWAGTNAVVGGLAGSVGVGGLASDGAAAVGNPVLVGGFDRPSSTAHVLTTDKLGNSLGYLGCTSTAIVTLSGTGYNEVVVGSASQIIKVCKIFVTSATGGSPNVNSFSLASATISTCAGTTELFAANSVTGLDSDWGGALQSGSGKSLCFSESVGNGDKITISYQKAAF